MSRVGFINFQQVYTLCYYKSLNVNTNDINMTALIPRVNQTILIRVKNIFKLHILV